MMSNWQSNLRSIRTDFQIPLDIPNINYGRPLKGKVSTQLKLLRVFRSTSLVPRDYLHTKWLSESGNRSAVTGKSNYGNSTCIQIEIQLIRHSVSFRKALFRTRTRSRFHMKLPVHRTPAADAACGVFQGKVVDHLQRIRSAHTLINFRALFVILGVALLLLVKCSSPIREANLVNDLFIHCTHIYALSDCTTVCKLERDGGRTW